MVSPCLPHASISTKMTSSRVSPDSILNVRLIARPNWQIGVPLGVTRNSGSRVRFPISRTLFRAGMVAWGCAGYAGSGRLDERAINAAVQAELLAQVGGRIGRAGEIDVHVVRAGQFLVRDAREVLAADALDAGDLALDVGDDLLH